MVFNSRVSTVLHIKLNVCYPAEADCSKGLIERPYMDSSSDASTPFS